MNTETRAKYDRRAYEYHCAAESIRNRLDDLCSLTSDPQVRATLETMAQELDDCARKWREETDPNL